MLCAKCDAAYTQDGLATCEHLPNLKKVYYHGVLNSYADCPKCHGHRLLDSEINCPRCNGQGMVCSTCGAASVWDGTVGRMHGCDHIYDRAKMLI